ncbi:MAG: beta-N-acetylhexosaminidase [Acidimicrobiales bacterium]
MIPAPATTRVTGERISLHDGLAIEASGELAGVGCWLRRVLEQSLGWQVEISDNTRRPTAPGNVIRLLLEGEHHGDERGVETEGYRLIVSADAVSVTARRPAGVFYGLQTLRQLLPDSSWRAAAIEPAPPIELTGIEVFDQPAFTWRGVHLDVSRHFMPKSFVLKLIDLISMHKCNVLHLHLTDDQGWRVPVAAYPRLVEVGAWRRESAAGHYREGRFDGRPHGGFYSTDDLREIVGYARERFVAVLPEIDMPGHMVAAIAAYPELGNSPEPREVLTTWGISPHVLNLQPATLKFCTDVLDAVMDIFPFGYIHVGGDECPTTEWEDSETAQALMTAEGLNSERQLQAWFTDRIAQHLSRRGRRLVGWDEILEGGAPLGAVVMSWRGEEGGIEAARAGHDVVMAPQQWLYLDWAYADDPREPLAIRPATSVERVWSYDPVPDSIPEPRRHHVLGAQCQLWTEYVPDPQHAEYLYFPRLSAFCEVLWSGAAARDPHGPRSFEEFEIRLRRHLSRLDAIGVNYRPLEGPTPGQSRVWERE